MCGIAGIVSESLSGKDLEQRVFEMGCIQGHRGPDGHDSHVFNAGRRQVALGFVRLAILDLETGMQPICSKEDGCAIVCNGQIYNYVELRSEVAGESFVSKGDVEVALHLYRRRGIDFLNSLNGMYAGAVFDPGRARLFLFRDRFGIKPLYYAHTGGCFAFSSEIKPLFNALNISPELNDSRLASYFVYRYVPGQQTMFKGIYRLMPGCFLEYDLNTGRFATHRYWNYLADQQDMKMNLQTASSLFFELFEDAVRIRMRADVEVGSFISGGIDSSAVAAMSAGYCPDMRLYTVGFKERAYDETDDVLRLVASDSRRFGTTRLNTAVCRKSDLSRLPEIIRAVEEPISLGTVLPTDCVCQSAARDVKTVLTGEGADEVFAGYRKFMLEAAAVQYDNLPLGSKYRLQEKYPELVPYLLKSDQDPARRYIQAEELFDASSIKQLLGSEPDYFSFPFEARPDLRGNKHPLNKSLAFEISCRLPDYVVLRLDKLSMRHGLETRTPFLDYRLAELAARLPVSMKANVGLNREKMICAYSFVRHGLLSAKTAFRRKQPFTFPMADWLSQPDSLPEAIREVISGDLVRQHNILDPGFAGRLAGNVTASGVGPQTLVSEADRLFSVIVFSLWYQQFIRK
jgi:asparagine synthase (glutamine-hydrolysing)